MVFGFVKQSGGHINVYSEPGVGTSLRLYLPRDRRDDERTAPTVTDAAPAGRGESVLVVDDNPAIRRLVARQLSMLGYQVEQAASAAEAIARLEDDTPIDLVFSDVVMAGSLDGYDLARIVAERWPQVAVVLTSGFPGTTLERNGGTLRGVRLLTKPYVREDLARTVRQAFDTHRV